MFGSIYEDVKRQYQYGNMVTRLVIINAVVFITLAMIRLIFVLLGGFELSIGFDTIIHYLSANSNPIFNLSHPWVIFTHMFTHVGIWHFIWNMLLFFWFGKIVQDLIGNQKIVAIYLLGGLVGFVTFVGSIYFLQGPGIPAIGASAAVMATVVAAAAVAPDYEMRLILLGNVRIKYIAAFLLLLDVVAVGSLQNTGGHLAHLGGAAFGFIFIQQLRAGNDLSIFVNNILDSIAGWFRPSKKKKKASHLKVRYKKQEGAGKDPRSHQEMLDSILEKIKESGYENLTEAEKEFLVQASNK